MSYRNFCLLFFSPLLLAFSLCSADIEKEDRLADSARLVCYFEDADQASPERPFWDLQNTSMWTYAEIIPDQPVSLVGPMRFSLSEGWIFKERVLSHKDAETMCAFSVNNLAKEHEKTYRFKGKMGAHSRFFSLSIEFEPFKIPVIAEAMNITDILIPSIAANNEDLMRAFLSNTDDKIMRNAFASIDKNAQEMMSKFDEFMQDIIRLDRTIIATQCFLSYYDRDLRAKKNFSNGNLESLTRRLIAHLNGNQKSLERLRYACQKLRRKEYFELNDKIQLFKSLRDFIYSELKIRDDMYLYFNHWLGRADKDFIERNLPHKALEALLKKCRHDKGLYLRIMTGIANKYEKKSKPKRKIVYINKDPLPVGIINSFEKLSLAPEEDIESLKSRAGNGDAPAMFALGEAYYSGTKGAALCLTQAKRYLCLFLMTNPDNGQKNEAHHMLRRMGCRYSKGEIVDL